MSNNALVYNQYMNYISDTKYAVYVDKLIDAINMRQMSPSEAATFIENMTGRQVAPVFDKTGKVYTGFNYVSDATVTTGNAFNSNATTVSRGTVRTPITTTIDPVTNTVKAGKIISPSQVGTRAYVMNSVASPLIAVATGITVGKTIDSALYNAFPDFFDSNGMSSFNPETWSAITSGVDYTDPVTGVSASLINMILGIDPETGEGQAYIDETAFAYMASYMQSKGVFTKGVDVVSDTTTTEMGLNSPVKFLKTANNNFVDFTFPNDLKYISDPFAYGSNSKGEYGVYITTSSSAGDFCATLLDSGHIIIASASNVWGDTALRVRGLNAQDLIDKDNYEYSKGMGSIFPFTYNNKTIYASTTLGDSKWVSPVTSAYTRNKFNEIAWAMVYGESSEIPNIDGIGTQTGATVPSGLTGDPATDLTMLQQQYPELWNNAIDYPVVQPDGTIDNHKYIPISFPDSIINGLTQPYTQPVSGGSTQAQPKVEPENQPFADYVAKLLQQPTDNPLDPDYTPPANPADTGEGSTPLPIAPTGSASALWSIYHPTQNEVDAFGAWLWSPSFIDQLAKIFNDPMQSIIGLHKVYATPVDAGTSTIAVGYLDSGVSSAYITQQYVTVDCGTVDVYETFGNVFDYTPYTDVKLYLPFVGIVSLDVADVMRGSLHISYEVDVLTGACLAVVTVNRDGNSAVMYQYAGNCAVQYPLSSGSYMGIISSIIGVAGTVAATIATGGSVAPLAIGAAGAAMSAHTTVQNSGSFSGNAGAMGGKKPYLIIKRPQSKMADEQQNFVGTPTNEVAKVGDYSGFVKCHSAHVEGINATSTELKMITDYLLSGILV